MRILAVALLCTICSYAERPPEEPRKQINEEFIQKGLDAQDFVDAKREYTIQLEHLRAMKLWRRTIGPKHEGRKELEDSIRRQALKVQGRVLNLITKSRKAGVILIDENDGSVATFNEGQINFKDPNIKEEKATQTNKTPTTTVEQSGKAALNYLEFRSDKQIRHLDHKEISERLKKQAELSLKLGKHITYPTRRVTSNPLYELDTFKQLPEAEQTRLLHEAYMRSLIAHEVGSMSVRLEEEFAILKALQAWEKTKPVDFEERLKKSLHSQQENIHTLGKEFDEFCTEHGVTTKTQDNNSLQITFSKALWIY